MGLTHKMDKLDARGLAILRRNGTLPESGFRLALHNTRACAHWSAVDLDSLATAPMSISGGPSFSRLTNPHSSVQMRHPKLPLASEVPTLFIVGQP